jgi:tetraprenyl-beta-curcumene synthase
MSTAAETRNGQVPLTLLPPELYRPREPGPLAGLPGELALPVAFAEIVIGYLTLVLPRARRELDRWRTLAAEIPDPGLRATARQALAKRGNIEGAALFATLAPAAHRARTIRALVAFQSAYNYLDTLSEQPCEDPAANADKLHHALLGALEPGSEHPDYYAHNPAREDGGYLHAILEGCRDAAAGLPSFAPLAPQIRLAAARIVDFQTLSVADSPEAMRRWANDTGPRELQWWESAAACGSSLSVHALISAAACPGLDASDARRIDRAYFPCASALHSLLDSLVDREEDERAGRPSLIANYQSSAHAAVCLQSLARGALEQSAGAGRPDHHRVIVSAMCSYYLSTPRCQRAGALATRQALQRTLGPALSIVVAMFQIKRFINTVLGDAYN